MILLGCIPDVNDADQMVSITVMFTSFNKKQREINCLYLAAGTDLVQARATNDSISFTPCNFKRSQAGNPWFKAMFYLVRVRNAVSGSRGAGHQSQFTKEAACLYICHRLNAALRTRYLQWFTSITSPVEQSMTDSAGAATTIPVQYIFICPRDIGIKLVCSPRKSSCSVLCQILPGKTLRLCQSRPLLAARSLQFQNSQLRGSPVIASSSFHVRFHMFPVYFFGHLMDDLLLCCLYVVDIYSAPPIWPNQSARMSGSNQLFNDTYWVCYARLTCRNVHLDIVRGQQRRA